MSFVSLDARNFRATIDGRPVGLHTIRNRRGMAVRITSYGARIEQVLVPDRHGRLGDVAQGYETIAQVRQGQGSMGAFIGRYAGRIARGRFVLEGEEHRLTLNDGPHSVHGGAKGSRFQVFAVRQLAGDSVEMRHTFADGEEGYPGALPLRVVYRVTDANELSIDFAAVAVGRTTVLNLTSHPFFNLSGDLGRPVLDHVVALDAGRVLETDEAMIPTGTLRDVAGTPLDFRTPTAIGSRIEADHDLLRPARGYDHTYAVAGAGMRRMAAVHEPESGRTLEVWSTEPAVQFFTANALTGQAPRDMGKGGVAYVARSAFCLEPQHYPDAPNHPHFPSTVLRRGARYAGRILYRFGVGR